MINACRTVIHCKLELAVLCGSNVRLGSQLRADSETRYFSPLTSSIEGSSESPHRISNFNFQNIVPPNSSFRLTAHVEDHQEAYAESASAVHSRFVRLRDAWLELSALVHFSTLDIIVKQYGTHRHAAFGGGVTYMVLTAGESRQ